MLSLFKLVRALRAVWISDARPVVYSAALVYCGSRREKNCTDFNLDC